MLPLEVQERILLYLPLSTLASYALTSSTSYSLCSSPSFWKRRLKKEGFPSPYPKYQRIEKWLRFYKVAEEARRKSRRKIERKETIRVLCSHINLPLLFPQIEPKELEVYKGGTIVLTQEEKNYCTFLIRKIVPNGVDLGAMSIILSPEEFYLLLYRIYYLFKKI